KIFDAGGRSRPVRGGARRRPGDRTAPPHAAQDAAIRNGRDVSSAGAEAGAGEKNRREKGEKIKKAPETGASEWNPCTNPSSGLARATSFSSEQLSSSGQLF